MPRLQEKGLGIWKAKRMFGFGKKKVDKAAWAETVYGQKLKNPEREAPEKIEDVISRHQIRAGSEEVISLGDCVTVRSSA